MWRRRVSLDTLEPVARVKERRQARVEREILRNRDFTIISNDCWGGLVYQRFGLPYNSPFVGMWITADDYIRLISDLPMYLACPLRVVDYSRHPTVRMWRARHRDCPVGQLGDVELQLEHFDGPNQARLDWERRVERVQLDRLWVKWDGFKDGATAAHRAAFDRMPFARKVMFVKAPTAEACAVVVPNYHQHPRRLLRAAVPVFDLAAWLNEEEVATSAAVVESTNGGENAQRSDPRAARAGARRRERAGATAGGAADAARPEVDRRHG